MNIQFVTISSCHLQVSAKTMLPYAHIASHFFVNWNITYNVIKQHKFTFIVHLAIGVDQSYFQKKGWIVNILSKICNIHNNLHQPARIVIETTEWCSVKKYSVDWHWMAFRGIVKFQWNRVVLIDIKWQLRALSKKVWATTLANTNNGIKWHRKSYELALK